MWTFYVEDFQGNEEWKVHVYSAVTFPSKDVAEKRAQEVSMLMGGVKWGVEEIKVGE